MRTGPSNIVMLLATVVAGALSAAADEPCWRWQRLDATSELVVGDVASVAYGGGTFVALDSWGWFESRDGAVWRDLSCDQPPPTCVPVALLDAVWDGERFVAVGSTSWHRDLLFSIEDSVVNVMSDVDGRYEAISWNGERYVLVGRRWIATSLDARSWVEIDVTPRWLHDVAWDGRQWVAVGDGSVALTSRDALSWTAYPTGVGGLRAVAASRHLVVAVGAAAVASADGRSWTRLEDLPADLQGVAWADGEWLAAGSEGAVFASSDGLTWTARGVATACLLDVAAGGGRAVAVGEGFIATSVNGGAWREVSTLRPAAAAVVWIGSRFVAADWARVHTSEDGRVWQRRQCAPSGWAGHLGWLEDFAWNGSELMAVGGRNSNPDVLDPALLTSRDGVTWQPHAPAFAAGSFLTNVVWTGAEWVVTTWDGEVGFSADATSWRSVAGGPELYDLLWDGARFVGLTASGVVTSADAVTWSAAQPVWSAGYGWLASGPHLRWNGASYLAFADLGRLATSRDAVTWVESDLGGEVTVADAVWDGQAWLVVREDGLLFASPDGVTWVPEPVGWAPIIAPPDLMVPGRFRLATNGSVVVAVADGITLLRACPVPAPRRGGGRQGGG